MDTGRILIVEDEPALAEILAFNLRRAGFTTLTAADGLGACRLAGAERPDLILLDLMLPDLDGWEICRLIRGHHDPRFAATPVIMLTALGTQADRVRGAELGADAYLTKPYSVPEVLLLCRRLLARRRQEDALRTEMEALRSGAGG